MSSRSPEETLLEFPCQFPIKAVGLDQNNFELLIVEIIQDHISDLKPDAITSRNSSNGKYLSVTITIEAQSKAQLDRIYQELSDHERVIMAL